MFIQDWRDIENGNLIPTEKGGYCDQPSLAVLPDGSWLCSVTTSGGNEGSTAQYVSIMKSCDNGKSWSAPRRLEPMEDGQYWESSYSKLIAENGVTVCFYCYNDMHITPEEAGYPRVDMGIAFCYRYSLDGGESWSERKKIPVGETPFDRIMPNISPSGKKVPLFWNVAKVLVRDGSVYVPLTKIGNKDYFMSHGEGMLLKSDDLLKDPENAHWITLPEDGGSVSAVEGFDTVCEEHCFVMLSDGSVVCTFRTSRGGVGSAVSRDGGRSFGTSELLRYPDGRAVKNTRANTTFWDIGGGRYLYWFTNCGHDGYYPRNPTWLCAAVEEKCEDGIRMRLSQPEIVLYTTVPGSGFSYPDIIVEKDRLYISETQKSVARVHEIPMSFIDVMFRQFESGAKASETPDETLCPGINEVEPLGEIYLMEHFRPSYITAGLTFGFDAEFRGKELTVLSRLDEKDCGVTVKLTADGRIEAEIAETRETILLRSERCLVNGANKAAVVFDFVAGVGYFVVNGRLLDGGEEEDCGWKLISRGIAGAGNAKKAAVGEGVGCLKVYRKALTVTECLLAQR